MIYLLPAIPYALHVVGIDEQESEGNCCDDDDGSHSVCLFQEQVLLLYAHHCTKSLIQCQAHSESILLSPRMSFGIPDADHGEWDKDCCQHCDCDDVHCVALVSCCMLPIIYSHRHMSILIVNNSRIMSE